MAFPRSHHQSVAGQKLTACCPTQATVLSPWAQRFPWLCSFIHCLLLTRIQQLLTNSFLAHHPQITRWFTRPQTLSRENLTWPDLHMVTAKPNPALFGMHTTSVKNLLMFWSSSAPINWIQGTGVPVTTHYLHEGPGWGSMLFHVTAHPTVRSFVPLAPYSPSGTSPGVSLAKKKSRRL